MPPHLHPRSRLTTSLFTTTLAVSFLVVGMPHVLPCPVDPKQYADAGEGDPTNPRRRRRRKPIEGSAVPAESVELERGEDKRRECPVPKPGGLVGQILGFGKTDKQVERERPVVVIRPIEDRFQRRSNESSS